MDIKAIKLNKKKALTQTTLKHLQEQEEVEEVHQIKDNMVLIKTNLNKNTVYYRVTVSEVTKNIDDWIDLVEEYKIKKGSKNDKK